MFALEVNPVVGWQRRSKSPGAASDWVGETTGWVGSSYWPAGSIHVLLPVKPLPQTVTPATTHAFQARQARPPHTMPMPILVSDGEQCELRPGANAIGGICPDAVAVSALVDLPRVAVITVPSGGGPAMIQRLTPKIVVKLAGATLGATPRELHDGAEIEVGGLRLRYSATGTVDALARPKASEPAVERLPAIARPRVSAATAVLPGVKHDAPVLAELEITDGPGAGRTHRITRRVCAIGRGTQNDVPVMHDSVSSSHASLMLKGDTWYLTDLHSSNGTYVDGYRIAGERALPAGCTLRMGKVEMRFRPRTAHAGPGNGTTVLGGGILRRLVNALSPRD